METFKKNLSSQCVPRNALALDNLQLWDGLFVCLCVRYIVSIIYLSWCVYVCVFLISLLYISANEYLFIYLLFIVIIIFGWVRFFIIST